MKRVAFTIIILISILQGCTKTEPTRRSGIDTIDNTVYQTTTYYVYGFSFSQAKLISNLANPGADIIVYVNKDNLPYRLTLQANNRTASFYKAGEYTDEASAKTAFDNLKSFSVTQWTDMADPIRNNQVWIYKADNETYTKIRIISTVNEKRQLVDYGECTFQWVYQPDGTTTFPAK